MFIQYHRDGSGRLDRSSSSGSSHGDQRTWTQTHFDAHLGKVPKPSILALTPPGDNHHSMRSNVDVPGPGGLTPLMVATISNSATECLPGFSGDYGNVRGAAAIIPDLIAEGASTDAATDVTGMNELIGVG